MVIFFDITKASDRLSCERFSLKIFLHLTQIITSIMGGLALVDEWCEQ